MDLDAFYASVEQLDDPRLRGKPVIVGGNSRRGVVCAASYEARKFGVRSAMPSARVARLCPQGIFLPPRFERYGELSQQVMAIFARFTPLVEPLSLDEAFLDVTESRSLHGSGRQIAEKIRAQVRGETGLVVSAGIAEVKFAAKIATDLGKPDGLVEVPLGRVKEFLAPLAVGKLWGVGKVTEEALGRLGCSTIGDVARLPASTLVAAFGAHGAHLKSLALGEDPRTVVPDESARSVGAEETFDEDIAGREAILPHLLEQSGRVARRMRRHGLMGRTVTVKLKYADFSLVTRRCTLPCPTDDQRAIFEAALSQLERADVLRPIRLTGVSVSGFFGAQSEPAQLGLFDARKPVPSGKRQALNAALDAIADRFGEDAVKPAALAGKRRPVRPRGPRS
jgi:DNA polymerase-4